MFGNLPSRGDDSGSRTIVRFHDDGELLGEFENAVIPGEGETVTLRAMRMMEGPPNPDLVDVEGSEADWDGETVERTVDVVDYEIRWMQSPDESGESVSSHVALVDIYLVETGEDG